MIISNKSVLDRLRMAKLPTHVLTWTVCLLAGLGLAVLAWTAAKRQRKPAGPQLVMPISQSISPLLTMDGSKIQSLLELGNG